MSLAVVAIAIVLLVVLVVWARMHAFLAFILVSAGAALALGMPATEVAGAVRKGIGDILGGLSIVIVARGHARQARRRKRRRSADC